MSVCQAYDTMWRAQRASVSHKSQSIFSSDTLSSDNHPWCRLIPLHLSSCGNGVVERMSYDDCGATVDVLYVLCRNAKTVKVSLEKEGLLHKQYRMTKPTPSSLRETCIAIPVKEECIEGPWKPMVVSVGRQYCPYSSSFLGNHKNACLNVASSSPNLETRVQRALLLALIQCSEQVIATEAKEEIVQRIKTLSVSTCPKKLEVIGDDRTLVIPQKAFRDDDELFSSRAVGSEQKPIDWTCFWKHFASSMNSPRVVRRGDIDPDSGIRESGHRLLWPYDGQPDETGAFGMVDCGLL